MNQTVDLIYTLKQPILLCNKEYEDSKVLTFIFISYTKPDVHFYISSAYMYMSNINNNNSNNKLCHKLKKKTILISYKLSCIRHICMQLV